MVPNSDTDVVYLKMFNTNVVVLNSFQATTELLEKRSKIYSDRSVLFGLRARLCFHTLL